MEGVSPGNPALLHCGVSEQAGAFTEVWEWHRDGQKVAGKDWDGTARNRGELSPFFANSENFIFTIKHVIFGVCMTAL